MKDKRTIKTIIAGPAKAGKSALLKKLNGKEFTNDYDGTIGTDLSIISIPSNIPNTDLKFQIWDLAGESKFRSLIETYYRGSDICMLVYDATDQTSLDELSEFKEKIQKLSPNIKIMLVATKTDLRKDNKRVSSSFISKQLGCNETVEISVKNDEGVDILREKLIKLGSEKVENDKAIASRQQNSANALSQKLKKRLRVLTGVIFSLIALTTALIVGLLVSTPPIVGVGVGVGIGASLGLGLSIFPALIAIGVIGTIVAGLGLAGWAIYKAHQAYNEYTTEMKQVMGKNEVADSTAMISSAMGTKTPLLTSNIGRSTADNHPPLFSNGLKPSNSDQPNCDELPGNNYK